MMKRLTFTLLIFCSILTDPIQAQTDLSALHAPPSQAEIDAVIAEWATRDHSAYNWTVLSTGILLEGFVTDIVSHEVNGDVHYAAVRYPENYDPNGSYPVLIVNHGGASGVNVAALNAYRDPCYRSYFIGLPSFRSEELRTGNLAPVDYTSGGVQSEMDGDTDDALSLLTGILAIPGADPTRIGVHGGSRGGGVSHLMASKDNRISRVCAYYGATDHMTRPGLQAKMENYVDNGGGLTPPEAATYTYGVAPYLDGTLTLAEARLELLRRSAIYFVDRLPLPYQIHHGDADFVVTVNNSQLIAAEFANLGITTPNFEYFEYPGAGHSLNGTDADSLRHLFFCGLSNISLDIELVDFKANCDETSQEISIEWVALFEQSSHVDLQHSPNGRDWATIKTFDSAGSSHTLERFSYRDDNFHNQQNYYRLKEIGKDGSIQFSKVISVNCSIQNSITLSPNPTKALVTIQLDKSNTSIYPEQVLVFDMNGQQVLNKQLRGIENENLDLSKLAKGTYSCHFLVNGEWLIKRVVLI